MFKLTLFLSLFLVANVFCDCPWPQFPYHHLCTRADYKNCNQTQENCVKMGASFERHYGTCCDVCVFHDRKQGEDCNSFKIEAVQYADCVNGLCCIEETCRIPPTEEPTKVSN